MSPCKIMSSDCGYPRSEIWGFQEKQRCNMLTPSAQADSACKSWPYWWSESRRFKNFNIQGEYPNSKTNQWCHEDFVSPPLFTLDQCWKWFCEIMCKTRPELAPWHSIGSQSPMNSTDLAVGYAPGWSLPYILGSASPPLIQIWGKCKTDPRSAYWGNFTLHTQWK